LLGWYLLVIRCVLVYSSCFVLYSASCLYATALSLFTLFCFFFNDPATTEIYTLSLHDALPIFSARRTCQTDTRGQYKSRRDTGERPVHSHN